MVNLHRGEQGAWTMGSLGRFAASNQGRSVNDVPPPPFIILLRGLTQEFTSLLLPDCLLSVYYTV